MGRRAEWKPRNLKGFVDIFNCRKKRELERIARSTTLYGNDLFGLILSAGSPKFPYLHNIHAQEFVPADVAPTKRDLDIMSSAKVGRMTPDVAKAFGKIDQVFVQRRQLVGHMFYTPDLFTWHFFYFDQRDTDLDGTHWKHGSHIHMLNFLWPNRTAEGVWQEFKRGNPRMKDSLHIRFVLR